MYIWFLPLEPLSHLHPTHPSSHHKALGWAPHIIQQIPTSYFTPGNVYLYVEKAREFQKNIYLCFIDYAKAFDCVDQNKLWKILKEMEIQDHLTFLLRNLYAGQEAKVRTGHGTTDWFQIGKGVCEGCILSPCLFNLYAEYIGEGNWHPTLVLLPGKFHGCRSLVGCSPCGH